MSIDVLSKIKYNKLILLVPLVLFFIVSTCIVVLAAVESYSKDSVVVWWVYPLSLFVVSIIIGILAVLSGIGGGVLFVPIVSSFFPFNIDFVRGAGLFVALSSALAAGPSLLRKGFANLRLAMLLALIASTSSIFGAIIGLAMPSNVVNISLGFLILVIVAVMVLARKNECPDVSKPDFFTEMLGISGIYYDPSTKQKITWKVHRIIPAMILYIGIGITAGMFGLGAGWANVPVLNLVIGVPIKAAVATSKFLLSITDTSAAFVYLNRGAVISLIAVPSIIGTMLGSFIGVRLLVISQPSKIRYIVLFLLLFTGIISLLKGFGIL